jgi:tRNA-binding protein
MVGYETVKSTLFAVALDGGVARFSGRGYGHGVGMSQWGAKGMADRATRPRRSSSTTTRDDARLARRARAVTISWQDFEKVDMRVGVVTDAKDFPEARRPALRSGSTSARARREALERADHRALPARRADRAAGGRGRQLSPKQIGPFVSEVLVLGAYNAAGEVILLNPISRRARLEDRLSSAREGLTMRVGISLTQQSRREGPARRRALDDRADRGCAPGRPRLAVRRRSSRDAGPYYQNVRSSDGSSPSGATAPAGCLFLCRSGIRAGRRAGRHARVDRRRPLHLPVRARLRRGAVRGDGNHDEVPSSAFEESFSIVSVCCAARP